MIISGFFLSVLSTVIMQTVYRSTPFFSPLRPITLLALVFFLIFPLNFLFPPAFDPPPPPPCHTQTKTTTSKVLVAEYITLTLILGLQN